MSNKPVDYHNTPSIEYAPRVGVPMELRCEVCGRAASYSVGRVCLDPSLVDPRRPESVNDAFGFTSYFHCKFCGAGGPWQMTLNGRRLLDLLMREATADPEHARLIPARMVLFDGTRSRWPTQGEAHLKALLAKEPESAFLWNRLGNLYKTADAYPLAVEAYAEALKRDPHQIEALHSLGEMCENEGKDEESAKWHHQTLLHARHAPAHLPAEVVRAVVDDSIRTLVNLHHSSGGRIAMLPELPEGSEGPSTRAILEAERTASSKKEGRERVIDLWVGSRASRTQKAPRPALPDDPMPDPPQPTTSSRPLGRNDPCPCGSGMKYKKCCGRS